ncbi:MAG TPA: hypothetical protein ENH84_03030, partial [Phycisphaerae bacterium]|nr:hypothetical protein [Phycisphaerae bacterium]
FASLLLLGIDSAFSITECVLASIVDKTGWSRDKTLIGISVVGLGIGMVYCFQGGLNWLGTFDDFINGTWGIALTALLEALVLGWLFRIRRLREHANERSDWTIGRWFTWLIRLVIPMTMAALFVWSLFDDWSNPNYFRDAEGKLQIGTVAGLVLMGIAPIVAVVISLLRFKNKRPDNPIQTLYSNENPHGRGVGFVSILMGAASLAVLAFVFFAALPVHGAATAEKQAAATQFIPTAQVIFLPIAGGVGLLGLLLGGLTVVRMEARTIKTSMAARLGAAIGILSLGLTGGLSLAMWVSRKTFTVEKIVYDNELSGVGYTILAVMLGLIVFGLGWCFYRAIRAGGEKTPDEQKSERIENT